MAESGEQEVRTQLLSGLPRFVTLHTNAQGRCDAIEIDAGKLGTREEFIAFAERIFSNGACFEGLDYNLFSTLAWGFEPGSELSRRGLLKLARDVRVISSERLVLYRPPRLASSLVEYFFEPMFIEREIEEPLTDAQREEGCAPQKRREKQPAQLDIDEFIAHLWVNGVRFGLDCAAISQAIASSRPERAVVAQERQPQPGTDAQIKEESRDIHRDNSPRVRADGKVDLGGYRNRFPQMPAGTRLISKIPRQLGRDGFDVHGNLLQAPLPQDIDLNLLAGPGVRVEMHKGIEMLVTARAGFLNIDTGTGQFSISEKIISREGVSSRTTGDLVLDGEEYEEYGEIQEKRLLKGKTITVHSDVYGEVVSVGGLITLKHNLVGGRAENAQGDIVVEGMASGATLVSVHGEIRVARAENCVLIAARVVVGQAVLCDIAADEVRIERAEGCVLCGKQVELNEAASRSQSDTLIAMQVPDREAMRARDEELAAQLAECVGRLEVLEAEGKTLQDNAELRTYLMISGRLQRQEIKLTSDQADRFRLLGRKLAPVLQAVNAHREACEQLGRQVEGLVAERQALASNFETASQGIRCSVGHMDDELQIHAVPASNDPAALVTKPAKELRQALRKIPVNARPVFSGCQDGFVWQFAA